MKMEMPFVPCGVALDSGQNRMNNIGGQIMIAGRYEALSR